MAGNLRAHEARELVAKAPSSPAGLPMPLRAPRHLPQGVEQRVVDQALKHIPPGPRSLSPRLRSEYLSLLSRRHFPKTGFGVATGGFGAMLIGIGLPMLGVALCGVGGIAMVSMLRQRRRLVRILKKGTPYVGQIERINVETGGGYTFLVVSYVVSGDRFVGRFWVDEADGREIAQRGFVPMVVDLSSPKDAIPWPGALDFRHD